MNRIPPLPAIAVAILLFCGLSANGADVFVRVRVAEPASPKFRIVIGGYRHAGDPWQFPEITTETAGGAWSSWVDLRKWPWHGKVDREGGLAEWPSMRIGIQAGGERIRGCCAMQVQLADAPDQGHVVHDFTEKSDSDQIGFLVPHPLREHAAEFETGTQMAARHRLWADQATGGRPVRLKQFTFCTALWGPYDPALAREELGTLRELGFNVIGGTDPELIEAAGARTYRQSGLYVPDPDKAEKDWKQSEGRRIASALTSQSGRRELTNVAHYVLADEVRTLDLGGIDPDRRDGWFRDYLRDNHVTDADLGRPIDQVHYPADLLQRKTLPRDADLPTRRLMYYAARLGQWWSAKQLRHSTDLIHGSFSSMPTETLPSDHGFFNAWGPPNIGMSASMLDLFEVARQRAVDQLSAEDWLGLNHMYGPAYTWTGAQSFEYLGAIFRSAIGERPILLRGLITPSDDGYLRLKAYSALGQGARSFFFWTYGPTYIGTENYWSDLRSQYDGLAKLGRALEQAEPVLMAAKPVRDPVAVLYSLSHDIWHSDDPAAFVEKRLLWHALRHLQVQPDFLDERAVAGGGLKDYRVLYVNDECTSRAASDAIDRWVRDGGVVYLSAGAATRDEFYEPHVPPFAATVWPDDAAAHLITEHHAYNERVDLPTIKPMAQVRLTGGGKDESVPVIGCRLGMRPSMRDPLARFDDNTPAAVVVPHGRGKVVGLGFMPMLAYGQMAHFQPQTLEERWPEAPRRLIREALELAQVSPAVKASEPVAETSLLSGPNGSVLVLANYTYRPIKSLTVELRGAVPSGTAVSTEGKSIEQHKTERGLKLTLPLDWTDMILLRDR